MYLWTVNLFTCNSKSIINKLMEIYIKIVDAFICLKSSENGLPSLNYAWNKIVPWIIFKISVCSTRANDGWMNISFHYSSVLVANLFIMRTFEYGNGAEKFKTKFNKLLLLSFLKRTNVSSEYNSCKRIKLVSLQILDSKIRKKTKTAVFRA